MFALLIAFIAPMLHAVSNILDARVSNFMFKTNAATIFYLGITNLFVLPFLILFGGVDILLPANVSVKMSDLSLFGGCSNARNYSPVAGPTVYVNATALFGGVEVK